MLKILVGLVLVGHGLGHSMGILQTLRVATVNPQWHGDSWILSGAGPTVTQTVGVFLWSIALIGFALAAAVIFGWLPESYFAALAVAASVASLAGIVFFPIAFPTISTLGALAIDIVTLAAVIWYQWEPSDLAV
ncbi:MAG TPA: hypothetical protein VI814_03415 [Candidatus Limnocylindria bacterium]